MKFFRKIRRSRKLRAIKPRYYGAVAKAVRKAKTKRFNSRVLKVIHKQAETKRVRTVNYGLSTTYIQVPDAPRVAGTDCFPVVPSMSPTPTSGVLYRIGESVKALSLIVRGHYIYTPNVTVSSENFNHMKLRIMCVTPKDSRDLTSITSNSTQWIQNLLTNGNSSQQFSNSVVSSAYLPINKERIISYYDKVFDLNQPFLLQTTATGINDISTKGLKVNFSFKIPMKNKTLMYDNAVNSGQYPTNFNPVLMACVTQLNGYANTTILGKLFYTSELAFEDM